MTDPRELAAKLPDAILTMTHRHIESDRDLNKLGIKEAFRALGIGYSQLMAARKQDLSIGPKFFKNVVNQAWLTDDQKAELELHYEEHVEHWRAEDKRRKEYNRHSVGVSDLHAFKRTILELEPDIAKLITPFRFDLHAVNFIAEKYVEQKRILGEGKVGLVNGLCLSRWIEEIDPDSHDMQLALASVLRLTIYCAYYISDRASFRMVLEKLKKLSEKSGNPWINSTYQQNVRRQQVTFVNFDARNNSSVLEAGLRALRAVNEIDKVMMRHVALGSWIATPLIARQAHIQSLILIGEISQAEIEKLEDERDRQRAVGFNSDATLIATLVIAEGYLYLGKTKKALDSLIEVERAIATRPHLYGGLRAVHDRIYGDVKLYHAMEGSDHKDDDLRAANALYARASFHFWQSGSQHLVKRISLRQRLNSEILKSASNWTLDRLLSDYRFREPIW